MYGNQIGPRTEQLDWPEEAWAPLNDEYWKIVMVLRISGKGNRGRVPMEFTSVATEHLMRGHDII